MGFTVRSLATSKILVSIIFYSICSSSMLLINKITVGLIPNAPFVTTFQLVFCCMFVLAIKKANRIEFPVDDFDPEKIRPYMIYCIGFALGIYSSMRSLEAANVETVIVFRCLTPLFVSVLDFIFLGREMPSKKSLVALLAIVVGAYGYIWFDDSFQQNGSAVYYWPMAYLIITCFNMVYGKHIIQEVDLSLSGTVLYTNTFSIIPTVILGLLGSSTPEATGFGIFNYLTIPSCFALFISAVVGTGISYAGWWCRTLTSATTFTLVGVMNKMATITVNLMIWNNHASRNGILSLMLCIIGGTFYRQAPLRKVNKVDSDDYIKIDRQTDFDDGDDENV
eukprot:GSMAST32.ASY1.ANO1.558.1 assembled CDS